MRGKKTWVKKISFISFIFLMFILSACSEKVAPSSSANNGDKELDEIEISVTHYPTGLYSVPYDVGMEKGFFEEEGIKIKKIFGSSGGGTTVRNVLSGELPFGDVSTSAVIQSYNAGAPLKIVSGGVKSVGDLVYVTRKDSEIESVQDVVGKSWGFTSPGSVTETTSQLVFEKEGIDPKSLKLVATGGISEGLTMLEAEEVDATLMLEPAYSVQKDKWKEVFRMSEIIPDYQQSVIISSPQVIKENPELVKRFVTAYQKSVDWIYENPDEAGVIFSKSAEIDEKSSIVAINDLVEAEHWGGKIEVDAMNNVIKGMQLAGTLKQGEEIKWNDILDMNFLPEDLRVNSSELNSNK